MYLERGNTLNGYAATNLVESTGGRRRPGAIKRNWGRLARIKNARAKEGLGTEAASRTVDVTSGSELSVSDPEIGLIGSWEVRASMA